MTRTPYEEFLAGERPDDILIFLSDETIGNPDALGNVAESLDDGVVLVLPGDRGRSTFADTTGIDPMDFAGVAMQTDGHIDRDCAGADCPSTDTGTHDLKFVFAFAEDQNEEVGGIYAEGDVVHAYAACSCGETYSDKWVVGEADR
ncbi:DUF5807 family protein [Halorarius litoreus]|uniref:DUF5807 family protein n=1 Tax=Halorarius litoreus TaxID=2962676 RepID=UPI0020CFE605|nr:DUF5807 family protein [Halorarius litoreus]